MIGLVEPINNRITDPRYYLNTPHQGTSLPKVSFKGREGSPKSERQQLPHLQGDAGGAQLMKEGKVSGLHHEVSSLGMMVSHFLHP